MAARRLGHLVIGTPDLAASVALLTAGLGFKLSDTVDGVIAFLRCSTDHHNVAFVESPVPLLQHYSWECDDIDHVGHTATALYRADPGRHVWGMDATSPGPTSTGTWRTRPARSSSSTPTWTRSSTTRRGRPTGAPSSPVEHVANSWGPNLPLEFIVPEDLGALEAGWERWPS